MRNKTGGRKKGTPNKSTAEIREKFQALIENSLDGLKDDLSQLEPKDRIKAVIEFSKFVLPTMKAIELPNHEAERKVIKVSLIRDPALQYNNRTE